MRFLKLASSTLSISIACSQLFAQAPAPAPAPAGSSYNFSGLIDGYYSYAANHPASRVNAQRNFDVRANSLSLNMTKFTLAHDADPIGFTLDVGFGRAWDLFNFQDTANGFDNLRYVPQAFVSFKPAKLKGLQVDFGKFYTSAGAELTETHLNWNYSRALMYANGPYYHFGVRTSMPVNKVLTVGYQLVNGWNNVEDNNSGKTHGFTSAMNFGKVSWFNTYYVGPEKTNNNNGFRHFYDTVLTTSFHPKVSTYVNFDYGVEKFANGRGSNDWIAVSGAAKFQLTDKIAFSPRAEYYYDKDGFITGTAQKLKEVTLTGEYKWTDGLISRIEYRRDWSDQPYFERGDIPSSFKSQTTFLIGLVAYFGPKPVFK
jgi:hypothetical protein